MKKKIIVLFIVAAILCLIPMQSFAFDADNQKESSVIAPRWTSIIDYQNIFEISGSGAALVDVSLNARSNINKVVINASIQQYVNDNWTTIKSWSSTSYSSSGYLSQTWYVNKGYYYRMLSTGAVYQNDVLLEHVSYTSPSHWY